MKKMLFTLAATALLGQSFRVTGQTTGSSQGQTLDHLFSNVIRSSVVKTDTVERVPARPSLMIARMNPADLRRCCEKIDKDIQRVYFLKDRNGKMKLQVKGIYTHGAALFVRLQLNNRSLLDYDVDSIAFLITATTVKGRPLTKDRSAAPPKVLTPVYVSDSSVVPRTSIALPGHCQATSIFVLPRFRLPPGQQLTIYVGEKNGRRKLEIRAGNWTLERARPV